MGPHHWSRVPAENQSSDPNAYLKRYQPANSLGGAIRGLMATAACARDDNTGTLVAAVAANNAYTVQTNEGLVDPATQINNLTPAITKPFLIRVVLPALSAAVAAAPPTIAIDGTVAVPLKRRDGSALVDGDLSGLPVEIQGDTIVSGAYSRARILSTLPSNLPASVDVNAINARIESRGQAYADSAVNRSVTAGRWVYAGAKGCFDQPGTGGFISPFGGHTMSCDYWTYQFQAGDGTYPCAPFAYRYRAFQVYIANQGWVTCGAVS